MEHDGGVTIGYLLESYGSRCEPLLRHLHWAPKELWDYCWLLSEATEKPRCGARFPLGWGARWGDPAHLRACTGHSTGVDPELLDVVGVDPDEHPYAIHYTTHDRVDSIIKISLQPGRWFMKGARELFFSPADPEEPYF